MSNTSHIPKMLSCCYFLLVYVQADRPRSQGFVWSRKSGETLHNWEPSWWLSCSPNNLEGNTCQIFGWMDGWKLWHGISKTNQPTKPKSTTQKTLKTQFFLGWSYNVHFLEFALLLWQDLSEAMGLFWRLQGFAGLTLTRKGSTESRCWWLLYFDELIQGL